MSWLGWLLLLMLLAHLAIFTFLGVVVFSIVVLFLKQYLKERLGRGGDRGE